MNKKIQYEILLVILIAIVIFNMFIILNSLNNTSDNIYNVTTVGNNTNGTVYKIIAGNASSNESVGVILGVHPREHEIHEAVNETIYNITNENGSNNLSKKFIIYYIKTNDNLTSREETRTAGEELGNKFIVPNIKKDDPFIVIDIHEIDPNYEYSNFIFSLSNRTDEINSYIDKLSNSLNLVDYQFSEGTSPEKVTKPIANQNINTLLMEISIQEDLQEKQEISKKLIKILDEINP